MNVNFNKEETWLKAADFFRYLPTKDGGNLTIRVANWKEGDDVSQAEVSIMVNGTAGNVVPRENWPQYFTAVDWEWVNNTAYKIYRDLTDPK